MNKDKIFLYCDRAILAFLCLLIFCLPFAKAGIEIFAWSAIFIFILKRILGYRADSFFKMLPSTELNKALAIFIVANALSVVFTANLGLSLRGFFGKELKFLAIYFMLVETIKDRKWLKIVLSVIIASVVLIVIDAGVQYFSGKDFIRGHYGGKLSSSFSFANGLACWLIVMIPLFLGLVLKGKSINKLLKILLLVLVVLMLFCLYETLVRGAWLGLIISIILMFSFIFSRFSFKIKLSCLFIGASLLTIFLILPQPIKSKIKYIVRTDFKVSGIINDRIKSSIDLNEYGVDIRLKLWKEARRIIEDYNFIGCGLNTYSIVARNYKSFEWGGIYPHNCYLQMTAEIGLFGLLSFLWVLFVFFKMGFRYLAQKNDFLVLGLLSGILAFLVHAFFDTHLYSLQLVVLFWYMLGLTMAVVKLGNNSYQNSGG